MDMFESLLRALPKSRSDFVNDLEIPEITLSPYMWPDLDDTLSSMSDSVVTEGDSVERGSLSTDTTLPLSRAMTDSDISYGRYKRYMSSRRRHSNPFDSMKDAVDLYPTDYLSSLYKYRYRSYTPPLYTSQELTDMYAEERRRYNRELRLRAQRILDNDYLYHDESDLQDLEDALRKLDNKALQAELNKIRPLSDSNSP